MTVLLQIIQAIREFMNMDLICEKDIPIIKQAYESIHAEICQNSAGGLKVVDEWLSLIMENTIESRKLTLGMLMFSTYEQLEEDLNDENLRKAAIICWLIEMFIAVGSIIDDMIDENSTRQGSPCWYKRNNVGLIAPNDALLLEQAIYKALYGLFDDREEIMQLEKFFRRISFTYLQGECLDMLVEKNQIYSRAYFEQLTKSKTATCRLIFPIQAALILSGRLNDELEESVRVASFKLAFLLQAQDDVFNCYGKFDDVINSDIVLGKCTWLIVEALELANDKQRDILLQNYGKKGDIEEAAVKDVYDELNLKGKFSAFKAEQVRIIEDFIHEFDFPFDSFNTVLAELENEQI